MVLPPKLESNRSLWLFASAFSFVSAVHPRCTSLYINWKLYRRKPWLVDVGFQFQKCGTLSDSEPAQAHKFNGICRLWLFEVRWWYWRVSYTWGWVLSQLLAKSWETSLSSCRTQLQGRVCSLFPAVRPMDWLTCLMWLEWPRKAYWRHNTVLKILSVVRQESVW